MSSMNPMSSIVSASSRTACVTPPSSIEPRFMWSMSLPGVATMTSTPLSSASSCTSMPCPPYIETARTSVYFANLRISSVICTASSLVGATISPCMPPPAFMSWSIDIEYAAVLPVPVCACPTTSLPVSRTGIAASCIGNVLAKPRSRIASSSSCFIPSSSNCAIVLHSAMTETHCRSAIIPAGRPARY